MRVLALALALALALPGCSLGGGSDDFRAARIPDRLLEGQGGNGWEKNQSASQSAPEGGVSGRSQTLVYEDKRSTEGYPGTLTVTTIRTLMRPTESSVRETVQERIRAEAEARGLAIEEDAATGARKLAVGADAQWFVYNGSVQSTGSLFRSSDARVKIYGEVFQCADEKAVVVIVGLAQTTDVQRVGGVPLPGEEDATTWREIASDPRGSIEGIRGSDGLAYNVDC